MPVRYFGQEWHQMLLVDNELYRTDLVLRRFALSMLAEYCAIAFLDCLSLWSLVI